MLSRPQVPPVVAGQVRERDQALMQRMDTGQLARFHGRPSRVPGACDHQVPQVRQAHLLTPFSDLSLRFPPSIPRLPHRLRGRHLSI